jgi:hypothetical protein
VEAREAKVGDDEASVVGHQDVVRLEVAVEDGVGAQRVEVLHPARHLHELADEGVAAERRLAELQVLAVALVERAARAVLADDRARVGAERRADEGEEVRVRQPAPDRDLVAEQQRVARREAALDHLRHGVAPVDEPAEVHDGEAALPDHLAHLQRRQV